MRRLDSRLQCLEALADYVAHRVAIAELAI